MNTKSSEVVFYGLARAATNWLSLCVSGLTVVGAVAFESWTVLAVSAAGYVALVGRELSSPRFWRRTMEELRQKPPTLPDISDFNSAGARHFLDRMSRTRGERFRILERTPFRKLPEAFGAQLSALADVETQAIALVRRLEQIASYLETKNFHALCSERDRLWRAAERANDGRVKSEYRVAHATVNAEIASLADVVTSRDLLLARLETVVGTLELVPCEIARVLIADEDARDDAPRTGDAHDVVATTRALRDALKA